ncbi:MAG: ABC transporter ATP-binding protein [Parcubacteria group bacterium]
MKFFEKYELWKKTLRIIWYFFQPYKFELVLLFLVMLVSGVLESINLAALYPVINYGLDQSAEGMVMKIFNALLNLFKGDNLFLSSCYLLIVITTAAAGMKVLNYFFSYRLMTKMVSRNQKEIFNKYIGSDYDFFVKNQQGKLIYTGTIASKQAASLVLYTLTAVNNIISLLLIFSLLAALTWRGTAAIVIVGAFYFAAVNRVMDKVIYKCGRLLLAADREKNVILNELFAGFKAIKIFRMFDFWKEKYDDAVDKSMKNQLKMLMGRVFPESLMKIAFYFLIAFLGIIISFKTGNKIFAWLPLFATFALIASRLFPAIQNVGTDLMVISSALPNTIDVYDLLGSQTKKIREGSDTLPGFDREIEFQNVWFKFNEDLKQDFLLQNVSFTVEKKKTTAIVGPSGNGKTTLINLLLRLYVPGKGRIVIDGKDIAEYSDDSYLALIGYVGQETFIYNDTIAENIRFGLLDCRRDQIEEAAKLANAHEFIVAASQGYDTIVGDAGIKLSGGQRQRIAIARAMLRRPAIMILDEATSSLDNISEKKVQDAINNISRFTTIVVVAHRLSTIQKADKILVVNNGRIEEQGKHEELLDKKGTYYKLYNNQLNKN